MVVVEANLHGQLSGGGEGDRCRAVASRDCFLACLSPCHPITHHCQHWRPSFLRSFVRHRVHQLAIHYYPKAIVDSLLLLLLESEANIRTSQHNQDPNDCAPVHTGLSCRWCRCATIIRPGRQTHTQIVSDREGERKSSLLRPCAYRYRQRKQNFSLSQSRCVIERRRRESLSLSLWCPCYCRKRVKP